MPLFRLQPIVMERDERTMKLAKLTILTRALLVYNIWTRIRGISELSGIVGH